MKRSKTQRRKGKIYPFECRITNNNKEREKGFVSDQCKEIEEKIEWEKLEISSRKLDTKGTFQAKMGTVKGRNGMDVTEAKDIKKR